MNTEQKPFYSGFGETTTANEVIAGRDLTGKAVVITGGHTGIGLETTKVLSNAGAAIVIGARDVTKAREAVSQIKNVEVHELDLAEPASVDEFAKTYRQSFHQCDARGANLLLNFQKLTNTSIFESFEHPPHQGTR